MGGPFPPNPTSNPNPSSPVPDGSGEAASGGGFRRPAIRVTTEFDSDRGVFSHRLSCRLLYGLAKLRLRLENDARGRVVAGLPELGLLTRHLDVVVDAASRSALLSGAFDLAESVGLRGSLNVKEQQGEVAVIANLGDSSRKIGLSSLVPPTGLPRATLFFPDGEVSVEEKKTDEGAKSLSVNGMVKSHVLNGVCTALYKQNEMNIRYCYKDDELSFIPSVSLPLNALSFAFKRHFSPSDKLSYWYHFDSSYWSAVYKHNANKHLKWKAGYESDLRLGWASLWVGDEDGKTKTAPMKMKVQFMVQVPQDNMRNSVFSFRVKKRWDL